MKKIVYVNNVPIGNGNVVIQSMTNTKTSNIQKTLDQIHELEAVGCEIIRVAVKDTNDANALSEIVKNINIPLVADIHFDYKLALLAIENGVHKIRINPGNMPREHVKLIVEKCKEKNIPIRIGVNSGSLSSDIVDKYGVTAQGMIEEAKREIKLLEDLNFTNIVLSLKATSIDTFIEANILASSTFDYPLHIGLTESGTVLGGNIRSSYAIGTLLNKNIGDTIRVSLTGNPVNEIYSAKEILKMFNKYVGPTLISCPTCGRCEYNMENIIKEIEPFLFTINKKMTVAIMGCIVNGVGEGKEADLGIAGGKKSAVLFKKGQIIKKIDEKNIVEELKQAILEY
jgi:(E)-4-hydroxy-3-methylbut-2-enyl-diphosphate synthase